MLIHFGQSSYFKANKGVDRYFLETYLLPGLERQAVIAGGSRGIELPVGENQEPEYLSLEEAKVLVLDWLEQSHNLLEGDKKKLERLKNYEQFADLASNIYQAKVQDPNKLVTSARLQNVAALREAKKSESTRTIPHYDPGKVIDDYNKMYLKLLQSSRVGISHDLLRQIVSGNTPSSVSGMREDALASVISAHLPRLHAAGSVGNSPEAQDYAVAQELGNIIRTSYPEMDGILNVLGDRQTAMQLREVTSRLRQELETTTSLQEYEKVQVEAVAATDNYLLNQAELKTQISNSFPAMGAKDRQALTSAIMAEMVSSAGQPLTSREIIERVSQKLNIPVAELNSIQSSLESSGVSVSIEYRQNELSLMVGTRHLTMGERNLLSKGINPFLVHNSQEKLSSLESKLLSEYNTGHGDARFTNLAEAYQNEQQSSSPDTNFLARTRSHFDQVDAYSDLSLSDKALIRRTKFGRWMTDTRSRFYETQEKFFDKWVDIEETITGKKWINKQLENWNKFAEAFTVKVGKTQIPLFRIVPWITDRIEEWKKVNTLSILKRTSGSTSWFGKAVHWTFKNYELGGFTVNGATAHFASTQWSKVVKWTLARTGMTGVVKYAGISATRTATRLLLKLGGKALARLGQKAIGAILTAATAIGTAIFAVGMVFDLISMGWQFLKEFVRNSEFRKTIIGWGAAIGTFFAAFNLSGIFASLGVALGVIFAWTLQTLLLALTITGITIASLVIFYHVFNDTLNLDGGIAQLATNILCNDGETPADPEAGPTNQVASCATCLVKYLDACYGSGKLSGSLVTSKFGCLVATAINPAAAEAIKASAVGYDWLQCVGFARAAAICAGGDLPGQAVASDYIRMSTPGYKFSSGAGSCAVGDFGIMDGAIGHIFVVGSNDKATMRAIDANFVCAGCVSDNNPIPAGSVAGCLKKN